MTCDASSSDCLSRGPSRASFLGPSVGSICASQHTSFDVWAYAEQRIRMQSIPEKPRRTRRIPDGHSPCIILQRTLLGFWPYGPRQPALECQCTGPQLSGEHATEATTPGADAQPRTSEPKGVNDCSATN